jgi:hypothetical protein
VYKLAAYALSVEGADVTNEGSRNSILSKHPTLEILIYIYLINATHRPDQTKGSACC